MSRDNIILAFTIILLLDFAIHSVILVNIWRKTSFTRMFPNGSIARDEKARREKRFKHLKYYLKWYLKNMIPASIRFLRIKGIIPPMNNRGIQVGDKVKVLDPELNYGDHIGIVADNNSQTVYDDFIIKVEFPTIPKTEGSLLSVFTEYFAPDELDVINEV